MQIPMTIKDKLSKWFAKDKWVGYGIYVIPLRKNKSKSQVIVFRHYKIRFSKNENVYTE